MVYSVYWRLCPNLVKRFGGFLSDETSDSNLRTAISSFGWHVGTGSGFALSDASRVSGLSKWLGQRLAVLEMLPTFAILIVTCFIISWMTEVVSNTTTANITLPVLAQMVTIADRFDGLRLRCPRSLGSR